MAVRNLSTQFLDIWAKLTTLQKVAIGAASVAVIAAVTVLLLLLVSVFAIGSELPTFSIH